MSDDELEKEDEIDDSEPDFEPDFEPLEVGFGISSAIPTWRVY